MNRSWKKSRFPFNLLELFQCDKLVVGCVALTSFAKSSKNSKNAKATIQMQSFARLFIPDVPICYNRDCGAGAQFLGSTSDFGFTIQQFWTPAPRAWLQYTVRLFVHLYLGRLTPPPQPPSLVAQVSVNKDTFRRTWSPKYTLRSHFDGIRAIKFLPGESAVLTASEDHTVKLWNLNKPVPNKRSQALDVEAIYTFRGHV